MRIFEGSNANEFYVDMLQAVLNEGVSIAPRGHTTLEFQPAVTILHEPRERVLAVYGRRLNPFFNLAECLWILAGRADAKFVSYYNSNMRSFLDKPEDEFFHAPYGERIRFWGRSALHPETDIDNPIDQITEVVTKLNLDLHTRQAVICLWNPTLDNMAGAKDIPCNDLIFLKVRDGKLQMTVCNRSNDINWGLTSTNIVQFTTIMEVIAAAIGVEVGSYHHFSDSLHLYTALEGNKDICNRVMAEHDAGNKFDLYDFVEPIRMNFDSLDDFDSQVEAITEFLTDRIMAFDNGFAFNSGEELAAMPDIKCPYLSMSFEWLCLYHRLKDGNMADVLGDLLRMRTHRRICDWDIACLESLNRRFKKSTGWACEAWDNYLGNDLLWWLDSSEIVSDEILEFITKGAGKDA